MENKTNTNQFIENEHEALKQAMQESINKGKLFNLNKWKKAREEQRKNAQQLLNETETEEFTKEERADLNLSKCVRVKDE